MDWEYVVAEVITVIARLALTVCLPYVAALLKSKIHNDRINKYVDKAQDVVYQCVDYVNQVYVDGLKKDGTFDAACQKEAFTRSKDYVCKLLDESAKQAIIEVFGDFELWVNAAIESCVRSSSSMRLEPLESLEAISDDD